MTNHVRADDDDGSPPTGAEVRNAPSGAEVRNAPTRDQYDDAPTAEQYDDAPTGIESRANTRAHNRGPTAADVRAQTEATADLTRTLVGRYVTNEEFRSHRRNVRLAGLGAAMAGLLMVAAMAGGATAYSRLGAVAASNRMLIHDLQECTTPTPTDPDTGEPTPEGVADPHECYDRSQARQAVIVAQIVDGFHDDTERILAALARQKTGEP